MSEALDLSVFVKREGAVAHMDLAVEGVACAGCIRKIESGLLKVPGIVSARLNFTSRRLAVDWRHGALDAPDVIRAVEHIGYRAHPFDPQRAESEEDRQARWLIKCLAVAGFGAMNVMLLSVSVWSGTDMSPELRDLFHWLSALIALPCAAYAGQPFFRSAASALRARRLNMDVPISVGVLLALGMSVVETAGHAEHAYFDSAVMLLFFLLCGRYLDLAMRRKTRMVAGNLAALKAEVAHRFDGCELVSVPAAALQIGDRLLVRPGERVPADGLIVSGGSEVDESLATGETAPRKVFPGATIYAGTVNRSGALTMRVTAVGGLIADVERLLENAQTARSRYLRLAERAARLYAPLVHATAALTLVGWLLAGASLHDSIITAIAVLIITCPCAIALAVPAVQVVASGTLFRAGVMLNSGDAVERLADVDAVAFDKTGTLTLPEPRVDNAAAIDAGLLDIAARLALSSRHPLAAAVAIEARERIPFEGAIEEPGQGVRADVGGIEARLGSPAFCGITASVRSGGTRSGAASAACCLPACGTGVSQKLRPKRMALPPPLTPPHKGEGNSPRTRLGSCIKQSAARSRTSSGESGTSLIAVRHGARTALLAVRQKLRSDAEATIAALRSRGLEIIILSGDRASAVAPVADALGVQEWRAGLTPAQKIAALDELNERGRRALMVGDGLNDAPALAAAHVSLSPVSAAQLAQAQADAVFLGERLAPVVTAVDVGRRARRLMRQNLRLAALYNAVAVPIAIAGLITPLIAALAMSGSSLLVTLNALRARVRRA